MTQQELHVRVRYMGVLGDNEDYYAPAAEVAERFPEFAKTITHPEFSSMHFTVDLTRVDICAEIE